MTGQTVFCKYMYMYIKYSKQIPSRDIVKFLRHKTWFKHKIILISLTIQVIKNWHFWLWVLSWVYWCFTSHVTIFQLYMWWHRCAGGLKKNCTYGRAPNAVDISQGSLTCPSYTDTGPPFLYSDSDTQPHLVAFYDTLGIWRMYSRLKPLASSRGHFWLWYQWPTWFAGPRKSWVHISVVVCGCWWHTIKVVIELCCIFLCYIGGKGHSTKNHCRIQSQNVRPTPVEVISAGKRIL